jgi:hypothetical protein
VVGEQFLNEIVSHRYGAKELVRQLSLEDPKSLAQHILFYGATNTNVFVAAYASAVGRPMHSLDFETFLNQIAPYENEDQLISYLSDKGIVTQRMEFIEESGIHFEAVLSPLKEGYVADSAYRDRPKPAILIHHEAAQLAQLRSDLERGHRVVFVTADSHLRRILLRDTRLHDLAGVTVSQIGLIALVDVMVGFESDSRSISRLVWAQPQGEAERALFDYFVAVGLRSYKEGMAMEMQDAAKAVAANAAAEAENRGINLHSKDTKDIAANARFLDRYQDLFFRNWKEAIDKKEAGD